MSLPFLRQRDSWIGLLPTKMLVNIAWRCYNRSAGVRARARSSSLFFPKNSQEQRGSPLFLALYFSPRRGFLRLVEIPLADSSGANSKTAAVLAFRLALA
jgi:hypothetical protein